MRQVSGLFCPDIPVKRCEGERAFLVILVLYLNKCELMNLNLNLSSPGTISLSIIYSVINLSIINAVLVLALKKTSSASRNIGPLKFQLPVPLYQPCYQIGFILIITSVCVLFRSNMADVDLNPKSNKNVS